MFKYFFWEFAKYKQCVLHIRAITYTIIGLAVCGCSSVLLITPPDCCADGANPSDGKSYVFCCSRSSCCFCQLYQILYVFANLKCVMKPTKYHRVMKYEPAWAPHDNVSLPFIISKKFYFRRESSKQG
eukprot:UN19769